MDLFGADEDFAALTCPVAHAPAVVTVDPAQLAGLKRDLERVIAVYAAVVPADRGLAPYEQGVVTSRVAWTDMEPGNAGVPRSGPQPGGFEMRWLTSARDNVVADAFLFADASQAEEYLELATSVGCRSSASQQPADLPPEGRYLEWSNPLSYAQQDVFLRRGRRVYRVAVVQAGVGSLVSEPVRARGFDLVSTLACGLPGAGCAAERPSDLV